MSKHSPESSDVLDCPVHCIPCMKASKVVVPTGIWVRRSSVGIPLRPLRLTLINQWDIMLLSPVFSALSTTKRPGCVQCC